MGLLDEIEALPQMSDAGWIAGGDGDLWSSLTWTERPDMSGSGAPDALQDVWVATVLAIRDLCGALGNGTCHLINLAAAPLVSNALAERVTVCAGYGAFVGQGARLEFGFRWTPEKWSRWIDRNRAAHLDPEADVHTWLETATHVVDLSTGDTMGDVGYTWPPLICWPKALFPSHPREARAPGSILLWRSQRAPELVTEHVAPVAAFITERATAMLAAAAASQILRVGGRGTTEQNHARSKAAVRACDVRFARLS